MSEENERSYIIVTQDGMTIDTEALAKVAEGILLSLEGLSDYERFIVMSAVINRLTFNGNPMFEILKNKP